MQNDKLLNCPFCDKKLKRFKGGYEHKSSQCVLSSFILTDVEVPKWNTRKPMERILEQLEEESDFFGGEPMGSLQKAYYCKGIEKAIEIVKGGVDNAG